MSLAIHYFFQLLMCLNPCCNGIYSMSFGVLSLVSLDYRLNPCCNGIYSMSAIELENGVKIDMS